MAEMSPLRRRMIEDMKIRNLSPATQRCYVHAVAKFSRYFKRSPDGLGLAEVRAYQVHLVSRGVSWDGFNQAVCALRFFYGVTLGRSAMVERIPYARKLRHLPVVLSTDEVARFLAGVTSVIRIVSGRLILAPRSMCRRGIGRESPCAAWPIAATSWPKA